MRRLLLTVVVMAGLVTTGAPSFLGMSKSIGLGAVVTSAKTATIAVRFTFADRNTNAITDAIYSDGWGSYEDGIGGVAAHIFASGSGDATLNLGKTRPNRTFNGTYSPDTVLSPANAPSGTFSNGGFINIHNVWQITPGSGPILTDANFSTGVGDFRWCGDLPDPQSCQDGVTASVRVTREVINKWTVTADPSDNDLNVLLQSARGSTRVAGYYHMPFQLEIECLDPQCQ
jgi:hypothetical protein